MERLRCNSRFYPGFSRLSFGLWLSCFIVSVIFLLSLTASVAGTFEFSELGASGTAMGKQFRIGPAGKAFLQDAFLSVPGLDLNGAGVGGTGRLSLNQLPEGITVAFQSLVSSSGETVELSYDLRNNGASAYSKFGFLYYLDLEIDESSNTFFNEHASVMGTLGQGSSDRDADFYTVDEPGFEKSISRDRLSDSFAMARLDGINHVSGTMSNDVAMCLGFDLGEFRPGDRCIVRMLVSSEGLRTGTLYIAHGDMDGSNADSIFVSGTVERSPAKSRLEVASSGNGVVTVTNGWYPYGAIVQMQATPAAGSHFLQWKGDIPPEHAQDMVFPLSMDQDRYVTAEFGARNASDLRVGVMCTRSVVKPGDRFLFNIPFANDGPENAGSGVVSFSDGAGIQWVAAKTSRGYADVAGRNWMVDSLKAGGSERLLVTAVASAPIGIDEGETVSLETGIVSVCAVSSGALAVGLPEAEISGLACGKLLLIGAGGSNVTIAPPVPMAGAHFGHAVAAMEGGLTAASIFPDGLDAAGKINLFNSDGILIREITAPAGSVNQRFGDVLAGNGMGRVCVGAPATSPGTSTGAVYLVDSNGVVMGASDPTPQGGNGFGETVAMGVQGIALGARRQTGAGMMNAGLVHVFDPGLLSSKQFGSPAPKAGDEFGASLCFLTNGVVIGAPGVDYADFKDCGAVYVFGLDGNLMATIQNPSPRDGARFGSAVVALGDGLLAVGSGNTNSTGACVQVFNSAGCWITSLLSTNSSECLAQIASAGDRRIWIEQNASGARSLNSYTLMAKGLAIVESTVNARSLSDSAVDSNMSNNSASVSIVIDAEAPKFAANPSFVIEANEAGEAVFDGPLPTVTDNYDSAPSWDSNPRLPQTFHGIGTNVISYWSVDSAGNTGTFSQVIHVVDRMPPHIQTPPDLDLPLGADGTCLFNGTMPLAKDNIDPQPSVTSYPVLPALFTTTGNYSVVYTARDVSGNATSVVQTIRVFSTPTTSDTTPPTISISVVDGGRYPGSVSPEVSAIDLESGLTSLVIRLDDRPFVSGTAVRSTGNHILIATALDGAGNMATSRVSFGVYANPFLVLDNASAEYSDTLNLRASLKVGCVAYPCAVIRFRIDGRIIGEAKTGADGIARLPCRPDLAPGTYNITAVVERNDGRFLWGAEGTARATINPEKATLDYAGDNLTTNGEFTVATFVDQERDCFSGNLERAAVVFGFNRCLADDSRTNVYGATVSCDSTGLAELLLDVGPGLYKLTVGTATNSYFKAPQITETLVSLSGAEGKVTGGGTVVKPAGSESSSDDHSERGDCHDDDRDDDRNDGHDCQSDTHQQDRCQDDGRSCGKPTLANGD